MARKPQNERVGSVWIRKRSNSPYWRVYWNEGVVRKEQSLKVTNKEVARKKAQVVSDLLETGQIERMVDPRRVLFAQLVDEFRGNYSGWSANTKKRNNGTLEILKTTFGHLPLSQFHAARIEAYLAQRVAAGLAPGTANRYLATIKSMVRCAITWGYLQHNPTERLKFAPEAANIPEALTRAEAAALLAALPPFARTPSLIALETGMRLGEIQRLQWQDVSLLDRTLTVTGTSAKNNTGRVIPMTTRIHGVLSELWAHSNKNREGLVYRFDNIKKSLARAGEAIGLEKRMHFHRFRHTYITWLLEAGVPINQVQYLAGHKDIRMTQRYDHPTLQRHQAATATLERFLAED